MNIKEFIPPVLNRLAKRALKMEDYKEYENYSQAVQVCIHDSYQNVELCNMIADKTAIHAVKLKEKPFNLNPTNVFLLSSINQYININSKKDLQILDFGGACGTHYFEIKRFMPEDVTLKWYVMETEQMVKSAKDRGLNNAELDFVSSVDEIKTKTDFIHSSCALHYVPDPYEVTNALINIRANWLLFNRMMFNENDRDFVTVQKSFLSSNGPGKLPKGYSERIISYPHTTISYQKFNSLILKNNYKLDWIFELSGSYQIKNEKIVGKGLLYVGER